VSADYASKALVQSNLSPGESIALIDNVFRVTYVQNYSGFSWFVPELPPWVQIIFQAFLFLLAILAFPIYLFYTSTRRHTLWTDVTFVCLVSSFLGHSVVDVFFPYTVDFLQVFRSPSANFADLYSYVGIGALLIEITQVYSLQEHRWKGLHQYLVDRAHTRKEFFDFIRKGCK
jgi:lipoprotein signal peptidase